MSGSALQGLCVVDLSHFLAGPLAAVQLADLGADVIRIDPPGGPRWQHPVNAVLQRGKRSIVLDLKDPDDRAVAVDLIDRADVLIESWRPGVAERLGIGPETCLQRNPALVYCSIPGFGRDDPRAGLPGWEGIVQSAAGLLPDHEDRPPGWPRFTALPMASSFAAVQAGHAIMAALIGRQRHGSGQHIEVALFDAAFELLGGGAQQVDDIPPLAQGGPAPDDMPQIGHYRCGDGRWIQLCLVQPRHLGWFVGEFLPQRVESGWADSEVVARDASVQRDMRAALIELMRTKSAGEWERVINEECGAPGALCQSTSDWLLRDQHARDSGAVIEVSDDPELGNTVQCGYPFGLSVTPPRAGGPRHRLDADREAILGGLGRQVAPRRPAPARERPLAGMAVVDVSQVLAGPTAGRILAEYGADVVKINSPVDRQHSQHLYTNSGKRSILLDLKKTAGLEVFFKLVDGADVIIENFTPGAADRLGIGEAAVRSRRPDIVYTSVTAFGPSGYRAGYRGREELGQAVTGIQMRWFGRDRPRMVFYPLNDYAAGNWAAFATLVALYHRGRTGEGQRAQTSLSQAATFHQVPYMLSFDGRSWDEPSGPDATGWGPWDRLYRCADRWIYLVAPDERSREQLLEATGLAAAAPDDLETSLATAMVTRPCQEWVTELTERGIAATVVVSQSEVMTSDIAQRRGLSVLHRRNGGTIRTVGPAPRLSATPIRPVALPGPPGADAPEILRRLGMAGRFDQLVADGVVLPELPADATFVGRFKPAT
ncbi:CaiB/BaiF CoA transferase family protein [Mycolicibacterium sp. CBM1]